RRRHTSFSRDWSSDVCSSDLPEIAAKAKVLSVERDADRAGRDLDLAPSARELEVLPVPRHRIDDAVIDLLVLARAGLVDLQVVRSEERRVGREGGRRGCWAV